MKQMTEKTFALYEDCTKVLNHDMVSMEDIFHMVVNHVELRYRTEAYRKALDAKLPAETLKKMKAAFPLMLPAAVCEGGRKKECIKAYTYCCQADIDGLSADRMAEAKRRLQQLPFVAMYYESMSGHGLHVLYAYQIPNAGFTPEVYRQAFRQGNKKIAEAIVADFDPQVESAVHGASLCHDSEAWLNPDAEPLKVDMSLTLQKKDAKKTLVNKQPQSQKTWPKGWTKDRVFQLAEKYVKGSTTGDFTPGNRHNYLVSLAMLLSDFGMAEGTAAEMMQQTYGDMYHDERMDRLVASCYKTAAPAHGLKQLPGTASKDHRKADVKMRICADWISRQGLLFDEISGKIVFPDTLRELTDRDINTMMLNCNVDTECNIPSNVFRAVLMSDIVEKYNPLTRYLESLPTYNPHERGSAIERVANMVHVAHSPLEVFDCYADKEALQKELQRFFVDTFKKWFVAMVASWIKPGIVNHSMLVLIGEQGIYKSTFLDALMPEELAGYRCRQMAVDFDNKDELLRATEFVLINLDEFDRLSDKDLDALKAIITTTDVNVRAPYGTTKERRMRIATYCGSGNKLQFLTDRSGNRRFLPFYVKSIDSPFEHPLPCNEMYAEALWLITKENFKYWFTTDDVRSMSKHVEKFADVTPEEELIDVYFAVPRTGSEFPETRPVVFLTTAEISAKLTSLGNIKKPVSLRMLNMIMRQKGFQRKRMPGNGSRGFFVVELDATTVNNNRSMPRV